MGMLKKVTFYSHVTLDFAHLEDKYGDFNSDIFVNNYKPIAKNYTRSLVCFEGDNDSKGISSDALGYTFSIYRCENDSPEIKPIYTTSSGQLSIVDYNVRNQQKYQYYVFKENDETISKALLSNEINTCWWDYAIIGLTPESVEDNIYKVNTNDVWLFRSNVSSDQTSQNFAKTTYQNLTKFPQVSIGKSNYATGSFSGLIGQVTKRGYEESPLLLEKWNDFCANSQLKLFKDRKGHKYIVDITSTNSSIADETREQATTVNVSWTQIADSDNYVIIGD